MLLKSKTWEITFLNILKHPLSSAETLLERLSKEMEDFAVEQRLQ